MTQIINGFAQQRKSQRGAGWKRNSKARCSGVTLYRPDNNGVLRAAENIAWRDLKNNQSGVD